MDCKLCKFSHDNLKRFSDHLRSTHNLSSEQYTINVNYEGVRPTCPVCNDLVRYVSFSFKKYCKNHAKLAMIEGGKIGGQAEAWNKGKTKEEDHRIMAAAIAMSGRNNPFYGQQHTQETRRLISKKKTLGSSDIEKRLSERSSEFSIVTSTEDYWSRQKQYLIFRCNLCGEEQPKTLQAFERGSRCYKCFPTGKSNWELDVFNFVKSLSSDAISGDRNILSPKELDVYVPSAALGIECHGLFWHSEAAHPADFNKYKHIEKFTISQTKGIKLLQIFEDEWRDKRMICESMILHRLGKSTNKFHARKLNVFQLSTQQERDFFTSTHISGYTPSKICFGLRDEQGKIVAALSLRSPRHKDKYMSSIEIARFSTSLNMSIPGGLSKLKNAAIKWSIDAGYASIMTYVDRRIGAGEGYIAAGFELIGSTGVDYWYTDNELRYDRFKFRAHDGKSEKVIASEARVSKIWGCGSQIMSINLKNN